MIDPATQREKDYLKGLENSKKTHQQKMCFFCWVGGEVETSNVFLLLCLQFGFGVCFLLVVVVVVVVDEGLVSGF